MIDSRQNGTREFHQNETTDPGSGEDWKCDVAVSDSSLSSNGGVVLVVFLQNVKKMIAFTLLY